MKIFLLAYEYVFKSLTMPYNRNTNLSHLLQKSAKVAPHLYSADGGRYEPLRIYERNYTSFWF